MAGHEKYTTEHLSGQESRFDLVNRAIGLAKYWIIAGHEPFYSNNMAVEVLESVSKDRRVLNEVKEIPLESYNDFDVVVEETMTTSLKAKEKAPLL